MRGLQANSPTGFLSTAALLLSSALNLVSAQTTTLTSFAPLFTVPNEATLGPNVKPNILDPNATDAQTVCPGYTASGVQRNQYGFTAKLNLAGNPCNVYGYDIDDLTLTVEYQSADRMHVMIRPTYLDSSNTSYYVLSEDYVPVPKIDDDAADTVPQNDLGFYWSNEPTFGFSVIRQSTGDVLFSSMGTKLVYENQFLEFVTAMPSNYNVYGLSETIHEFRLGNNFTKTFWNADVGDPVDYNIYGSHPFYLDTRYYEVNDTTGEMTLFTGSESDADPNSTYISNSHILYNRNSHGQDILLRENNITWRALGGSMDMYFFSGPTVKEATSQYQNAATGLPAMQQYWTFGYHQCRWGYQNWSVVEGVVDNFAAAGIPLETIWNDIDYMDFYRDFENSPNRFSYDEAAPLMEKLRNAGQHYVPIVDSAVYVPNPNNASDAYPSFDSGNSSGAFVLNPDGSLYIGDVWPGYTVFPDWLDGSGGGEWWAEQFKTWHDKVEGGFWSGIWIDMSEASSFCVGSCGSNNLSMNPVHPPFALPGEKFNLVLDYPDGFNLSNATAAASASSASASQSSAILAASGTPATPTSFYSTTPTATARNINYPPYVINNVQGSLGAKGISPNATHHDGNLEYDVHNIWGLGILNATYQALAKVFPGERPFIIGRSTFVSAGKFAGHWGGDNYSKFYYMYISISQALQFSLAGIPMFGVDTCGFNGNTDYELCSRWMQLSAFFPFYRNHNTLTAISQEPYIWSSVTDAAKAAMGIRFNLLPYMYTLFYHAAKSGDTVLRALSWEVPYDPSLASADRQLFLGPAILVTPVLEHNVSTVNGVFPGANKGECYYDWYTQEDATQMGNVTIDAPLGHIPVYIRGGYVLPMQQKAMVTRDARMTPWSVLVALNKEGTAAGDLYLDDGVSVEPNATSYTKLSSTGNALYASTIGNYSDSNPLANVTVLGLQSAPCSVTLNGMNVTSLMTYNQTSKVMVVNGLQNATGMGAWAQDWAMKWS